MGNNCSGNGIHVVEPGRFEQLFVNQVEDEGGGRVRRDVGGPSENVEEERQGRLDLDNPEVVAGLLKEFQDFHFKEMIEEMRGDKNVFVLNLLLMAFQFFPNFKEGVEKAEEFKKEEEFRLNQNLMDGGIGGLRISMMHGLGEELAKNFIYRPVGSRKIDDSEGGELDETRSMLMSEELLPNDFFVSYNKLQVHTEGQYNDLLTNPSSSSEFSIENGLCMQENVEVKGDKIQLGYVRLYKEDSPRIGLDRYPRGSSSTNYSFRRESDLSSAVPSERNGSLASEAESDSSPFVRSPPTGKRIPGIPGRQLPDILPAILESSEKSENSDSFSRSINALAQNSMEGQGHAGFFSHLKRIMAPGTPSSGYGTSQTSTAASSISPQAAQIRARWLRDHLSQFPQFTTEQSVPSDHSHSIEIPPHCFDEVIVQNEDNDSLPESDDELSSSSSESIPSTQPSRKKLSSRRNSSLAEFIRKKYLNPHHLSSQFCWDFLKIRSTLGISDAAMSQAQITGTTIRCIETAGGSRKLTTFTPCLQSKHWPVKLILRFIHQPSRPQSIVPKGDHLCWPRKDQIQKIANEFGLNLIPLPPVNPEILQKIRNSKLEWRTNFSQGETILLNSFQHVQWRTYIFTALLFRAYIFPKGPKGVTLDHIRNLLYMMCQEDVVNWNDERGGSHLVKLLDKLYECLSIQKMTNFFVPIQNMMKHLPEEDLRMVQGVLSKIRENLIGYSIQALKGLKWLKEEQDFYPKLDLDTLYELVTVQGGSGELILIANKNLKYLGAPPPSQTPSQTNSKKKGKKRKIPIRTISSSSDDPFDLRPKFGQERDFVKERSKRRHERWLAKQERKKKAEEKAAREKAKINTQPDLPRAKKEKEGKRIDLDKLPVSKFDTLRMVMIIDHFIPHFLKMASQAIKHKAWPEATMFIMYVQNLCQLLQSMELSRTNMDETRILEYLGKTEDLKGKIGDRVKEYLKAKASYSVEIDTSLETIPGPGQHDDVQNAGSQNNFYCVPRSTQSSPAPSSSSFSPYSRPMHRPRVAASLRSFPSNSGETYSMGSGMRGLEDEFEALELNQFSRVPRRDSLRLPRTPPTMMNGQIPRVRRIGSPRPPSSNSGRSSVNSHASVLY